MKAVLISALAVTLLTGCKAKKDKYDFSKVETISLDARHTTNDLRIAKPDTIYLDRKLEAKTIDFNKN